MRKEFRNSINTALHNPNLTGALGRFSEAYRISREKAYEGIDFEAVRTQIAERKGYAHRIWTNWRSGSRSKLKLVAPRFFAPTIRPRSATTYFISPSKIA